MPSSQEVVSQIESGPYWQPVKSGKAETLDILQIWAHMGITKAGAREWESGWGKHHQPSGP